MMGEDISVVADKLATLGTTRNKGCGQKRELETAGRHQEEVGHTEHGQTQASR